jgi:hypothetical protein
MMRKMSTPRFLFHVTDKKSWGKEKVLKPKIRGKNRGIAEPGISRTCVSPDISRCLLALPYEDDEPYYIYRTYKKVRGYYPYDVEDSCITYEKWLTTPITFIKIGEISTNIIRMLPAESCCFIEDQRKALPKIKKILRDNLHVPIEYI